MDIGKVIERRLNKDGQSDRVVELNSFVQVRQRVLLFESVMGADGEAVGNIGRSGWPWDIGQMQLDRAQ